MKVHNPFRVALVATLGVGVGLLLISSIQTLSTILLYVGTALFLSLGLEPAIAFLERRKLPRWTAVLITILGLLALFAGIVLMLVPIIASQISQLIEAITKLVESGTTLEDFKSWLGGVFPNLKAAVYQLVPASKRARFIDIAEQITKSVGYFVMGQVTMGVINGVLSAIFLTIIGAPFPAVLNVTRESRFAISDLGT